ncbi:sulfotransferase [Flavobacteriaceae bacterium TK19130]|nr:sulfotransferase [Thermobacterium salinum]
MERQKNILDFLIVGAAKCGTTSLADYLNQNKAIQIARKKEPKYLTYEFLKNSGYQGPGDKQTEDYAVKSFEEYIKLFDRKKGHVKLGEASVDTLYFYQQTIPKIKKEVGSPKIIIMLRDPVKRAISAYSHLVRDERETESFEKGLELEEFRMKNGFEFIWAYKDAGLYYDSVKAFRQHFDHVMVLFFEDFIQNPVESTHSVMDFLGVEEKHTITLSRHNISGTPKMKGINRFLSQPSKAKDLVKRIVGQNAGVLIKNKIQERNLNSIEVSKVTKQRLFQHFEDSIEALEEELNVSLERWKAPYR